MADKWEGKVAVVTGASCGMGAAIFKELAKNKIKVIGLARRLERVEAIIDELKLSENAFAFKCDVSDSESIKKAFEWIESKFGVVNILVNNAGVCKNVNILDESEEAFEKMNEVIDVNVRGLTQCTREAFRLMKKSEDYGIIINMNSITGHSLNFSDFPMNLYPATKHAVTALTEVVRQELVIAGNKKLRVTSLSPGVVTSEIAIAGGFSDPDDSQKHVLSHRPTLGPEDVSNCVMFLLSTPYHVNITEITVKPVGERM